MKKLLFLLLLSTFAFGQKFTLTTNNFAIDGDPSKDFIVLDFPNKSKAEIYLATMLYLNKEYDDPKKVIANVENEQIVINANDSRSVADYLDYFYQDTYSFKDGKIKYQPHFKNLEYLQKNHNLNLPLQGFNGLYSSTGEPNDKIIPMLENYVNQKVLKIKESILKQLYQDF